jgi:hypothetical protein
VFEDAVKMAGPQSYPGYAEATITIVAEQAFYQLPFGCRVLVQLEKRNASGNPETVIRSTQFYQRGGAIVLSNTRGFRLDPVPTSVEAGKWTLVYLRAPGPLHYAKASAVGDTTLTSGDPPTGGGEIFLQPGFYSGVELRIFASDNFANLQSRVVTDFIVTGPVQRSGSLAKPRGVFHIREAWNPTPVGDVWYEIAPTVPVGFDNIYALDAAIQELRVREKPLKAESLERERKKMWRAGENLIVKNVMDRAPQQMHPPNAQDSVSTGEMPYFYAGIGY